MPIKKKKKAAKKKIVKSARKKIYRYKTLEHDGSDIISSHDNSPWKIGEWRDHFAESGDDYVKTCEAGFHCSKKLVEARSYVNPGVIALVEVKGKVDRDKSGHKEAWQKMRIVKAWFTNDRITYDIKEIGSCGDYLDLTTRQVANIERELIKELRKCKRIKR